MKTMRKQKRKVSRAPMLHAMDNERGISLFVVMIVMLLTTLLMLWAARAALFNERVTSNDVDYQRAFEAAEALIRDAEFDILGVQSNETAPCVNPGCRPAPIDLSDPGVTVTANNIFYPQSYTLRDAAEPGDLELLQAKMGTTDICFAGICISQNVPTRFWENNAVLTTMQALGARYGQFTHAAQVGNPLLGPGSTARYWVEPLEYKATAGSDVSMAFTPVGGKISGASRGYVYRITAVVDGRRPGTRVVLQTIFVRKGTAAIV